jgi:hypothetical protein
MRRRNAWIFVAALAFLGSTFAFQRPFRVYRSMEPYDAVDLPPNHLQKSEWIFGRLMYPPHPQARFGRYRWGSADWREGGTSWTQDYPRADRHFSEVLRRLTRLHVRPAEQPVNLDDGDDVYDYPFLMAGEMGDWLLTDEQVRKLRDYLLRGGFLMLDDFWGTTEWNRFQESMRRIFPDREIVDVDDDHQLFHTVYDIGEKFQIPGDWAIRRGTTYREDGQTPHFMAMYDDEGRAMIVVYFNNDVGDSWEWADDPTYPEKYSSLGMKLGVNAVIYGLTH